MKKRIIIIGAALAVFAGIAVAVYAAYPIGAGLRRPGSPLAPPSTWWSIPKRGISTASCPDRRCR